MPHVQDSSGVSWSRVRYCGSNEGSTSLARHPAIRGVRCGHLVPRTDERHAGSGGFSEVQMRHPPAFQKPSRLLVPRRRVFSWGARWNRLGIGPLLRLLGQLRRCLGWLQRYRQFHRVVHHRSDRFADAGHGAPPIHGLLRSHHPDCIASSKTPLGGGAGGLDKIATVCKHAF